jgi:hypothetical protein
MAEEAINPLRRRMIEDMTIRNLDVQIRHGYLTVGAIMLTGKHEGVESPSIALGKGLHGRKCKQILAAPQPAMAFRVISSENVGLVDVQLPNGPRPLSSRSVCESLSWDGLLPRRRRKTASGRPAHLL